jgi:hypothetical protein
MEKLKILAGTIIPICAAMFFGGCGSSPKYVRWYPGPPKGTNEVALLTVQRSFAHASSSVESIDGQRLARHFYSLNHTREIELLPGSHTLGVAYYGGSNQSISNRFLSASFQSGHTYNLRSEPIDAGLAHALLMAAFRCRETGWWTAWITDTTTQEVVAGVPRLEPRRWYER